MLTKNLLCSFLLLTLLTGQLLGQDSYQKGYFIDDTGGKKECLIKNVDWKNNPTKFSYKIGEQSDPQDADIMHVREFVIEEKVKYKRFDVEIERSYVDLSRLGRERNPKSKVETLFLKAMVEGEANLYAYADNTIKKFFYSVDDADVQQLIFINYLDNNNNVKFNNHYRQQILNQVKCKNASQSDIDNLDYSEKDLFNYFSNYNICKDVDQVIYVNKEKKDLFNLTIRPGISYSSLELNNISEDSYADFGGQMGLRFGLEFEFLLPYNNNKWAVLIEPTFKNYSSDKQTSPLYESVKYQAVEVPLGLRHYIFLNSGSKLFINASFIYNTTVSSSIKYTGTQDFGLKSKPSYAFGIGFKVADKYGIEVRYNTPQDIQREDSSFWEVNNFKMISVIFGFSLL